MHKFFVVGFLLFFITLSGYSQNSIEIIQTGGQNDSYFIDSISKICFTATEMSLEGVGSTYLMDNIRKINFSTNTPTAISENKEPTINKWDFILKSSLNSISLSFELQRASRVYVTVFNSLGKNVKTLLAANKIGEVSLNWDGIDSNGSIVSNGVYTVVIEVGGLAKSKQFIILR